MKILLDTNAVSRLFVGHAEVLEIVSKAEIVYLSVFVLGELYAGFFGGRKEKENRKWLQHLIEKPTVKPVQADQDTADYFGRLKHHLSVKGKPIPINDVWIAAHALQMAAVLLTFDAHFENIAGLRTIFLSD